MKPLRTLTLVAWVLSGLVAAPAAAQNVGQELDNLSVQPFQSRLNLPIPGLVWVGATAADNGNGFGFKSGSYFTVGSKFLLFEDQLNGNWMLESRVHAVEKNGNWFGNFGLERSFFLEPANAELGLGVWYDGDFDREPVFGHVFHQIAINGFIKTNYGDWRAIGYLPVGTTDYLEVTNPFRGNRVIIPGQDSALQGFDSTFRFRLPQFELIGGYIDVGGYAFRSNLIEPFGGVITRAGIRTVNGLSIGGELTHDNLYRTSGLLQVVIQAGQATPSTTQSGREFEPTPRNDHIVQFHRAQTVAINPVTGLPYNAIHVNNTVAGPGTGTFEDPFNTMALAQAGSSPNDLVFVTPSPVAYGGIALQNGQLLLGGGSNHPLPVPGGVFILQTAGLGPNPVILNPAGPGVTLSTGGTPNTVAGLVVQASATNDGIFGMNVPAGATLRDLSILGGGGGTGSGINLQTTGGTFNMTNTNIQNFDGPAFNLVGGAPNVNYSGSIINTVGRALQITGTTGGTAMFSGAITDTGGTGIQLLNVGGNVNVASTTTLTNSSVDALNITGGSGAFTFSDLGIVNAAGAGVLVNGGIATTSITLNGTGLQNIGGRSVDIQNLAGGSVTFNSGGVINDASGAGVFVINNAGPVSFNNQVDVVTSLATAVTLTNNTSVSFFDLDIIATDVAGLAALNNANLTITTGTATTLNGGAGGGIAVNIANAVAGNSNVNFVAVNAANANAGEPGVFLSNLVGTTNLGVAQLVVAGGGATANGIRAINAGTVTTAVGSAITVTGAAAVSITSSTTNMTFNTLTSVGSVDNGILLNSLNAGSVFNVLGVSTITTSVADAVFVVNSNANVLMNSVNINMTAPGRHGIHLLNNVATSNFTLAGGNSTINVNAAAGSNGVNINNSIATITNANIQNTAVNGTGINVIATGGNTTTVSLSNNILTTGIGNHAITLSSTGGSTLNATIVNNAIAATAFSINASANTAATLCLNASGNTNGVAGMAPTGNFALTSAGVGTTFNVTQLSPTDLQTVNNGVGLSIAGPINFNAGVCPTP